MIPTMKKAAVVFVMLISAHIVSAAQMESQNNAKNAGVFDFLVKQYRSYVQNMENENLPYASANDWLDNQTNPEAKKYKVAFLKAVESIESRGDQKKRGRKALNKIDKKVSGGAKKVSGVVGESDSEIGDSVASLKRHKTENKLIDLRKEVGQRYFLQTILGYLPPKLEMQSLKKKVYKEMIYGIMPHPVPLNAEVYTMDIETTWPDGVAVNRNPESPRYGYIYIADTNAKRILQITPKGNKSTLVEFFYPTDLKVNPEGDLYVKSGNKSCYKKITFEEGHEIKQESILTEYQSSFGPVSRLQIDKNGNMFFYSKWNEYGGKHMTKIQKIVDGNLVDLASSNYREGGFAVDHDGKYIYLVDRRRKRIRQLDVSGVPTMKQYSEIPALKDEEGKLIEFKNIEEITVDGKGNLYVADVKEQTIHRLEQNKQKENEWKASKYAGSDIYIGYKDGPRMEAQFKGLQGIHVDSLISSSGQLTEVLFIVDEDSIRMIPLSREAVSSVEKLSQTENN